MAKLNKQEVNAIAGKLHRELEKASKESRENAMRSYTPSSFYATVSALLKQRDHLSKQIAELETQRTEVINKAEEILQNNYNIWWKACCRDTNEILNMIVGYECKLKEVPSVEELKDEVTIAAIDDSFDTSSFIKEQLIKFK